MSRAVLSFDACALSPCHAGVVTEPERRTEAPPRTPRERARAQTEADIVRLGRQHLAVHGAAALSLRAVARDLGLVSSAVYRYVKSRDELLTLLLIDAFDELGDQVEEAVKSVPEGDHFGRFWALGQAVRAWALREPASYALLFGSPVPGYEAPAERTTGPGTRVVVALVGILDAASRAGRLMGGQGVPEIPSTLGADIAKIRSGFGLAMSDELVARGVLVWSALFGAVSFEVFNQYGPGTFSTPYELFNHHLHVLAGVAGLAGTEA